MESALVSTDPATPSSSRRPTGKGRKKIEIAQIVDKNQQQVTFSKRRTGLFKKAVELCVQCNVEIAIVTFSPGGKVYCFGHPNAEATMNYFLFGDAAMNHNQALISQHPWLGGDETLIIHAYNCQYEQALQELEKEKRVAAMEKEKGKRMKSWWEEDVDVEAMAREELMQYTTALEEMMSLVRRVEMMKNEEVAHLNDA